MIINQILINGCHHPRQAHSMDVVGNNCDIEGGGVHVQTLPKAKRAQGLNVVIKETSLLVHLVGNHLVQYAMFPILREPIKNYLALRGGGTPPFPLRVFGQDDFLLRGEGGTLPFR